MILDEVTDQITKGVSVMSSIAHTCQYPADEILDHLSASAIGKALTPALLDDALAVAIFAGASCPCALCCCSVC
jgi:hypothetical protein